MEATGTWYNGSVDKYLIKIILYIAGAFVIYQTLDIIFLFYIALLLALSLNSAVTKLQSLRLPRGLSILSLYLCIFVSLSLLIVVITPPLIIQTRHLIETLPETISSSQILVNYQAEITKEVFSKISLLPQAVLGIVVGLFSNLITIFTTLVLTFYLLVQRQNFAKFLDSLPFAKNHHVYPEMLAKIENRLGNWFFGEFALMFAVGLLTFVGLKILNIDSALPLAIIAGLLEIIPNIGPTISAVPAVLVALTVHPILALSTIALYFIVQFIENNFLVPKIMQKAVGINPVVSILGLMVGFKLGGPMGAILAIPTIITFETAYLELTK